MKKITQCLGLSALLSSAGLISAFAQAAGSMANGGSSGTTAGSGAHATHDVTSNGGTPNSPDKTSTAPNAGINNPVAPSPSNGPASPGLPNSTPPSVSQNGSGTTPTIPNSTNPNPRATNGGWANGGGGTTNTQ